MRLKFLFFPVMLIISISIFVGYIWPEINSVRTLKQDKMVNEENLRNFEEKKDMIDSIGSQLAKDNSSETLVNNYLPPAKSEEKIINSVNYLATDSGVSLVNIMIKDDVAAANSTIVAPATGISNTTTSALAAASTGNTVATGATIESAVSKDLQYSEATIVVSGEYEKIRLFLDQIEHMPIFTKIKTLTISQQTKENSTDQQIEKNSSALSANITIQFGYLDLSKTNNQRISAITPTIDNETITVLKDYVSQKSLAIDNSSVSGKSNPFLP